MNCGAKLLAKPRGAGAVLGAARVGAGGSSISGRTAALAQHQHRRGQMVAVRAKPLVSADTLRKYSPADLDDTIDSMQELMALMQVQKNSKQADFRPYLAKYRESKKVMARLKTTKQADFRPYLAKYRESKKVIARLQTIKREREIAEGVSPRESKRAHKRAKLDAYKKQLAEANIIIQRPKSTKLRWKKRKAAREAAKRK